MEYYLQKGQNNLNFNESLAKFNRMYLQQNLFPAYKAKIFFFRI